MRIINPRENKNYACPNATDTSTGIDALVKTLDAVNAKINSSSLR